MIRPVKSPWGPRPQTGRRHNDGDRGSASLDAVVILPLVVVLTLLVVQFVMVWHGRHLAQAAAQSAARTAAAYQSTAAAGQSAGAGYIAVVAPRLLPRASVHVDRGGTQAAASVHAEVLTIVPFATFTVDEQATSPVEAFTPATP
ncbi:TadE/TadG family type IV pilus assembly protein [Nakamurella multipartita]|uniref:TadE family protein n=1 Tax=Nakamurella multipartita (strain ATCC 700099 / DSM 44233 / CIP 104796 / JCM 9543 / NBRC 105858 / Y-104) TaxID=479431 RepID=C8X8P9_NAKMY|nr:TadE/TadG family type IV pilus assembly protein [Nakamurella multipartita]ACV79104.1 TadE family protein [Nakamurella multipartita DSM 44233]